MKVRMGVEGDRELVEVIRSATDKPLCVDANQGWTDKERALETICWLAERNTLFVEQPLPKEMIERRRPGCANGARCRSSPTSSCNAFRTSSAPRESTTASISS